jgi:hypothetical protein
VRYVGSFSTQRQLCPQGRCCSDVRLSSRRGKEDKVCSIEQLETANVPLRMPRAYRTRPGSKLVSTTELTTSHQAMPEMKTKGGKISSTSLARTASCKDAYSESGILIALAQREILCWTASKIPHLQHADTVPRKA